MALEQEPQFLKDEILEALAKFQPHYSAGIDAQNAVRNKSFTGVVGPFGIGKTSITNEVSVLEPRIVPINTKTTRGRKYGKDADPEGFVTADEGVTFTSFKDDVDQGNLINYSVIPGVHAYGTDPKGFPGEYNIGPLLPSSVDQIINAGFRDFNFVYIVAPGEMWRNYVNKSRRTLPEAVFKKRALESLDSIEFARDNPQLFQFVESLDVPDGIKMAAQKVINITMHQSYPILLPSQAEEYLAEMQRVAEDLAVHS